MSDREQLPDSSDKNAANDGISEEPCDATAVSEYVESAAVAAVVSDEFDGATTTPEEAATVPATDSIKEEFDAETTAREHAESGEVAGSILEDLDGETTTENTGDIDDRNDRDPEDDAGAAVTDDIHGDFDGKAATPEIDLAAADGTSSEPEDESPTPGDAESAAVSDIIHEELDGESLTSETDVAAAASISNDLDGKTTISDDLYDETTTSAFADTSTEPADISEDIEGMEPAPGESEAFAAYDEILEEVVAETPGPGDEDRLRAPELWAGLTKLLALLTGIALLLVIAYGSLYLHNRITAESEHSDRHEYFPDEESYKGLSPDSSSGSVHAAIPRIVDTTIAWQDEGDDLPCNELLDIMASEEGTVRRFGRFMSLVEKRDGVTQIWYVAEKEGRLARERLGRAMAEIRCFEGWRLPTARELRSLARQLPPEAPELPEGLWTSEDDGLGTAWEIYFPATDSYDYRGGAYTWWLAAVTDTVPGPLAPTDPLSRSYDTNDR